MQVWDSGIGISDATLPRIFDEFFQVQSQRPLQAHQRKGLGLGLAIVKRLAGAAGSADQRCARASATARCSRSRCRSGKAVAQRWSRPCLGARAPLGPDAAGPPDACVVEDEPAVREGLVVLLQGLGRQRAGFRFGGLAAGLAGAAARTEAPDLLLVDYRLPQGQTGLDALAALRAAIGSGATLPAIVITGSTIGGHESEAADARLPPADQAGAAEQAARDDRLQAGRALSLSAAPRAAVPAAAASTPGTARPSRCVRPGTGC